MKLNKLHIEGYKNLENIDIDFSESNVTALIGTNGSGKSNVLEAISLAFSHTYIESNKHIDMYNRIDLQYDSKDVESNLTCEVVENLKNGKHSSSSNRITLTGEKPNRIIAVYSGEEKRLWEDFYFDNYDRFNDSVRKPDIPFSPLNMYYINKYYWNLIFMILAVFNSDKLSNYVDDINKIVIKIKFDSEKVFSNNNSNVAEFLAKFLKFNYFININVSTDDEKKVIIKFLSEEKSFTYNNIYNFMQGESIIDLFENFSLMMYPKDFKIIESLDIDFGNGRKIKSLSEGEKKILVLDGVYELLTDNETLVLLDEPDTYIHESHKKEVYDIIKNHANEGVCTVLTSHSPTLIKYFKNEELCMLVCENGKTDKVTVDKIKAIEKITNYEWSLTDANTLLNSNKILVLFEGKTDMKYLVKARELYKVELGEKYSKTDFDYLSFGGTGNYLEFYEQIRSIVGNNRKIISVFDRDEAGVNELKKIFAKFSINESPNRQIFDKHKDIQHTNYYLMLPNKDNIKFPLDFVVEDYFPRAKIEDILKKCFYNFINGSSVNIPSKDVKKTLKEKIDNESDNYNKVDYEDFKILIDKLYEIEEDFK